MKTSYSKSDVVLLLKDLTGQIQPLEAEERENRIQSGTHYSDMLPAEHAPSERYMQMYDSAMKHFGQMTADAVASVSEQIWRDKGDGAVLVSLARAGLPIGILIKRYIYNKYHVSLPHYGISIIRGKGIDKAAMEHIIHYHGTAGIQFVDGWTGKGAIQRQLTDAMQEYPEVEQSLAVLSDPARVAEYFGTREDFLIPCSMLNSVVSGLISRTISNNDLIHSGDYHGAVYYESLASSDISNQFLDDIEALFRYDLAVPQRVEYGEFVYSFERGLEDVHRIMRDFDISDINFVKPSVGETTRVLLRRIPWKILVKSKNDYDYLGHIYQLAMDKGIELIEYPELQCYRACGIIKNLADT